MGGGLAKLKNKKHELFCQEYLIDLNATQAYLRTGYKVSDEVARANACKLLTNANVEARIAELMDKRVERTEITADKVLKEYAKIGFADIKDFVEFKTAKSIVGQDNDGEDVYDWRVILAVKDSSEIDGSMISEVSISRDGTFKFKLHDKMNALEKIGKHLNMFDVKADKFEDAEKLTLLRSIFGGVKDGT